MKTVFIEIVLILTLLCNLSFANDFRDGKDPDGFRGMKWGEEIGNHAELKFLKKDSMHNKVVGHLDLDVYVDKDEKLNMGNAELERVEYLFHDSRLFSVTIYFKGNENWNAVKRYAFEKYGKVDTYHKHNKYAIYWWFGDSVQMSLQGFPVDDASPSEGQLALFSRNVILFGHNEGDRQPRRR